MKKILFLLISFAYVIFASDVLAKEATYGDLYNVQWCPCNPEEPFNADGSVVLGKTVMCPCDGMYSGYKKGFEQDMREIKQSVNNQLRKLNYFKYYLGLDYNIGKMSAGGEDISIDDITFASGAVKVKPDDVLDDQDSLSLVAGVRVSKYFGLETFYQQSYDDNTVSYVDNRTLNNPNYHMMNEFITNFKAYGLDMIGYAPMSPYFDFVGLMGIAQYKFENEGVLSAYYIDGSNLVNVVESNFDEDKIGYRFGLGAQLNIADGVALRAMYKYIYLGGDLVDNLNEFSLGLRFLF